MSKKMKKTRVALLMSALSIVLCFSMLVGTTFAWFTDEAVSARNTIVSGNLDMKVSIKPYGAEYTTWTEVDSTTEIFNDDALYEPGYTEAVWFKVENVGNLAFKYNISLDVFSEIPGVNQAGDSFNLSDSLVVVSTPVSDLEGWEAFYEDREDLENFDFSNKTTKLSEKSVTINNNGVAYPKDDDMNYSESYVLVMLQMPTTVGNEANHNGIDIPKIEIGLNAFATQLVHEEDTFGPDYDKDATYENIIKTEEDLIAALEKGGLYRLGNDITLTKPTAKIYADTELNLGQYTLYGTLTVKEDVEVSISNGKIYNENSKYSGVNSVGNLTLNNVSIESARHAIRIEGGIAVINGGSFLLNEVQGMTQHALNVSGGANVTVNGGTFVGPQGTLSDSGAAVNVQVDSTVTINGGNFSGGKNSTLSNDGTLSVTGGTYDQDPAAYVAAGYKAEEINGLWSIVLNAEIISTSDGLVEALENGDNVFLQNNIVIDPANMSNAYGTTGVNVKNGQTIDGNGYTLDIKGAGGTWDSGINTTGGTIRNITITGSFRGVFINHNSENSETVILENVTIDGTTYTISCDQGNNQNLIATESTFNGWTSYAATLGTAKFVDCDFGEGNGYAFCRPYAPTTFIGCEFEAGYEIDPRAKVTFENCTIDGVSLTADNLATLVTSNIENATVIG